MLIRNPPYIIDDRWVRFTFYDIDGASQTVDITPEDVIEILDPWLKQNRSRLIEIMRKDEQLRKENVG